MINWAAIQSELTQIQQGLEIVEKNKVSSCSWQTFSQIYTDQNAYQLLRFYQDKHQIKNKKQAVLLVYSWINQANILDFSESSSLVKLYQSLGFDVFLVNWKLQGLSAEQQHVHYYYQHYLNECVSLLSANKYQKIHLAGICQGGVFALAYAALYPKSIGSVTVFMAPIDPGHQADLLYQLAKKQTIFSKTEFIVPGYFFQVFFSMLKPNQCYYGRLIDAISRKQFTVYHKIEAWLNQTPDLPSKLLNSYFKEFIEHNCLMQEDDTNQFSLRNISCPVINIVAKYDRLVHPKSSLTFRYLIESDYNELIIDGGHLSALVDGKIQNQLKQYFKTLFLKFE